MLRFGFTLVELVVVVLILGIIAAIAIPKVVSTTSDAGIHATMTHLRAIEQAAVMYNARTGGWPADNGPGVFPPELDGYIHPRAFTQPAAIGGKFDWNHNWGGMTASISVWQNPPDTALYSKIDQMYDDGDLATGRITRFGPDLNLIIE